jgi:CRISPR-associated protein (TIGR03986 family)
MSTPIATWPVTATKTGEVLTATVAHSRDPAKAKQRTYPRGRWDAEVAAWFDSHGDGDIVEVVVAVSGDGQGSLTLRARPVLTAVQTDPDRKDAVVRAGGFVNPYTFVPALPRGELTEGPGASGLGDSAEAGPPSHARYTAGQWAGFVRVRLTTLSPLLLPDTERVTFDDAGRKTYQVRCGPDGLPLITGSSLKGALRSAYEAITASRFGVFRGHGLPLAYRIPARQGIDVTPAVVEDGGSGTRVFRLCLGDAAWNAPSQGTNVVQAAAWVPAYPRGGPPVTRVGGLAGGALDRLHGLKVTARLRLYQYQSSRPGGPRFKVWRATHVADSASALRAYLSDPKTAWDDGKDRSRPTGSLTLIAGTPSRTDEGWLSITRHSIGAKHDERFFVCTSGDPTAALEPAVHDVFWKAVLRAYDDAAEYSNPASGTVRSRHVESTPKLRTLGPGTLVYVTTARTTGRPEVTGVHPVMIGRMPFATAPDRLLDPSVRPAQHPAELSAADRVFGWVPAKGKDTPSGQRTSSGYRGRLAVRQVRCMTPKWRPEEFPDGGAILAPLSTPKPTQFRFYASPTSDGRPMPRRVDKAAGYLKDGGLRGRKVYRWRQEDDAHWRPSAPTQTDDRHREYLVTGDVDPKQNSRHLGWVRRGVVFEADLFVDGLSRTELGALLWLLGLGDRGVLRLGGGKPLGFGAVRADIDWAGTRLWDGAALAEGWRGLDRPTQAPEDALGALAEEFEANATAHPVLAEAVQAFLAASTPVAHPVHYPRTTAEPDSKSYEWFVANEKDRNKQVTEGWALPHVRDPEPRLPYLPPASNQGPQGGGANPRGGQNPGDGGSRRSRGSRPNGQGARAQGGRGDHRGGARPR